MDNRDDLIGMRFEIGGGYGSASGVIVGRAGNDHYIVQRDDDDHLELCAIADLLAARFFPSKTGARNTQDKTHHKHATASPPTTKPRLQDRLRRN